MAPLPIRIAPGAALRPPRRPLAREDLRALPLEFQDDEWPSWASWTIAACTWGGFAFVCALAGFCAAYLYA